MALNSARKTVQFIGPQGPVGPRGAAGTPGTIITPGAFGQFLVQAATLSFVTLTGDVANSVITAGLVTVLGITGTGSQGTAAIHCSQLVFDQGQSAPTITQQQLTSDSTAQTLSLNAQNAFPSATTNKSGGTVFVSAGTGALTNGSPGNVIAIIPSPTGTGAFGFFQVTNNGVMTFRADNQGCNLGRTDASQIGMRFAPLVGQETLYGGWWIGANVANPSGANYFMALNASTTFWPLGVSLILGSGNQYTFNISTGQILLASNVSAPGITVSAASSDATTNTLTFAAQAALPGATTNRTGGLLILQSGAGATTNGTSGNVEVLIAAGSGTGTSGTFFVNVATHNSFVVDSQGVVLGRSDASEQAWRFAPLVGNETNFAGIWNGASALAPTGANYTLASNATSDTFGHATQVLAAGFIQITNTAPQITFAAATPTPTYQHTTQISGSNPNNMIFVPQAPNSGSTTLATNTPGSFVVQLAAVGTNTVTGAEAVLLVQRTGLASPNLWAMGAQATTNYGLIWGPFASGGRTSSNYMLAQGTAGDTYLQSGSGSSIQIVGQTQGILLTSATNNLVWTSSNNIQLFSSTTSFGASSVGVLGWTNVTTTPTSNPTGGIVLWTSGANTLNLLGSTSSSIFLVAGTGPGLGQSGPVNDVATNTFTVVAQSAFATAVTNVNGAFLSLQGGAAKTNGTTGLRGGVRLILGATSSATLLEVTEPVVNQRVVALCQIGSGISSTQMPTNSGDGVIWIASAVTLPTAAPGQGITLAVDNTTNKGLHFYGPSTNFFDYMVAPTTQGTANSQANKVFDFAGVARTTTNTAVTILTIPLSTSGTNASINVTVAARDVTSGTVGDGFTALALLQYKNVAGTVTAGATQATQLKSNDTSMASCTLTATVSGTNILIQVTGLTSVTIDWTAIATEIIT